mgnify:CR=1 FL=1
MDSTWERIEKWLQANAPEAYAGLNQPATEEEIAEAEQVLGITLPQDVRRSYLRHNGQAYEAPWMFYDWEWLSLDQICDEWRTWKDLLDGGDFDNIESEADGRQVRGDWWNPAWIPLTFSGSGDHHCLDLAPGPEGTSGQIIEMWHDEGERPVVAASFGEFLVKYAEALETGRFSLAEQSEAVDGGDEKSGIAWAAPMGAVEKAGIGKDGEKESKFMRWASREHSTGKQILTMALAGLLIVVTLPFLVVVAGLAMDRWLYLPSFAVGAINPIAGVLLAGLGLGLGLWSVEAEITIGEGTPVPLVPTQKLVVQPPFTYCRNPMTLGTILAYLGVCVWIGSISALVIVAILTTLLLAYVKFIEEKELAARFGADYLAYKRETPFILPRKPRVK